MSVNMSFLSLSLLVVGRGKTSIRKKKKKKERKREKREGRTTEIARN
jgi:hypothetical protein